MNLFKQNLLVFLALSTVSILGVGMVGARYWRTGDLVFLFLVWNLFLAWIPLATAGFAAALPNRPIAQAICGAWWLLFFPNAPYLVTDLMHLSYLGGHLLWFDTLMFATFALTGLVVGYVSLRLMQGIVARYLGVVGSWGFVVGALLLSSYGIFVGRFLRWNSWDLFVSPLSLARDMAGSLFELRTIAVTFSLAVLFIGTYAVLVALPRLTLTPVSVREGNS
jgi:uncharacterized membrane protein